MIWHGGGQRVRLLQRTMDRIFLILLLAILLGPGFHSEKSQPVQAGSLLVRAEPLALDANDPDRRQVGQLDFLGGWTLTSSNPDFGGISSMVVQDDGDIIALSDSGVLSGFRLDGRGASRQFIAPLPMKASERDWPIWKWDSEALQYDPDTGRYWIGFELIHRICRYGPAFARIESCAHPKAIQQWPKTGGSEAMIRLPDGRFLVFAELAYGPGNSNALLLFSGDPSEDITPPPLRMGYRAPSGFRPTDAVYLGGGQLLVLNRRVTIHEGFTATISLVTLPLMRTGTILTGKTIAKFAPPLLADNFEAMAISRENGRRILWIASDDNHKFYQRSLLLKFALPERVE